MPTTIPSLPSLRDLAWQAATLAERLDQARRDAVEAPSASEEAWTRWAKACAFGDREALDRRLAWDAIDRVTASRALSDSPPPGFDAPPWTAWLPDFLAEAEASAAEADEPGWSARARALGPTPEPPFVEVWLPVVRAGRRALAVKAPSIASDWPSSAVESIERHLLRQIAAVGELAVYEEFCACRDPLGGSASAGYDAFVRSLLQSGLPRFFETYPVLARQLAHLVETWVEGAAELSSRLDTDRPALEAAFGTPASRIASLVPGLSDRHAGGRTVWKVTFDSGLALAYKPREVGLEAAFNRLLAWLHETSPEVAPPAMKVVDRGTHGWMEWVEQEEVGSPAQVEAYFRKAGALTCLVHLLGGTDLHSENLVAAAGGPVLVDTEMLLRPVVGTPARDPEFADDEGDERHGESCLAPGLVSLVLVDSTGRAYDVGGLQEAPARTAAVGRRRWSALGRDDLRFEFDRTVAPMLLNDLRHAGRVQPPAEHRDQICGGFAEAYRTLVGHRAALSAADGPLAWFEGCQARVLFRPSDQYAGVQAVLATPRYQRSGLERSLGLETLGRTFCRSLARPLLWPLLADERRALEGLDIPRLTLSATSRVLETADGTPIAGYLAASGLEAARWRLAAMDEQDLEYQLDELRAALTSPQGPIGAAAPSSGVDWQAPREVGGDDAEVFRDAARLVGAAVLSRSRPGPEGRLAWPATRGRLDLYGGTSGILVFLSALASLDPDETWRRAALATLEGIRTALRDEGVLPATVGGCSGLGSIGYALSLASSLLGGEAAAADAATLVLDRFPAEAIDRDDLLDVEGGAAGAVLSLLGVHEVLGAPRAKALAGRAVGRLLSTQLRSGADAGAWPAGTDARPRPGFAHGAAGIAYALSRWLQHDASQSVADAIALAWRYERRVFDEAGGVWPTTLRDGSRLIMAAWCHGAPGIGLARACGRHLASDDRLTSEVQAAVEATLGAPGSRLDHVCCGNLSRAESLLTIGQVLDHPGLLAEGRGRTLAVARRVLADGRLGLRGKGFERGATVLGFFQGLSGIGYQLLRSLAPDGVPSVLAFHTRTRRVS